MTDWNVHGYCADEFETVAEAFNQNFDDGLELGASLYLTHSGDPVVDLRGGFTDFEKSKPWQENTITNVFSSTKIPTICAALLCVDRGLLELDARVVDYWPGFARGGKEKEAVTVRQALTHRALVPAFNERHHLRDITDWDLMVALVEQEPAWFSSDTLCYHAVTYGTILGELVQRATGENFRNYFKRELTEPLGADFQMGLTDRRDLDRVSVQYHDIGPPPEAGSMEDRVLGCFWAEPEERIWETWEMQTAIVPASNGYTNARGLCRFGTMLANKGELDGTRFLSDEIVTEAQTSQVHAEEPLLGDLNLGLGFGLDSPGFIGPTEDSFHWGGYGGSWCFMDSQRNFAGAYVMNHYMAFEFEEDLNDLRMRRLWDAISAIIR